MSKLTTRDHVWNAALEVAMENATGASWSRRFSAADVVDYMDDPPHVKTVREALASMAELGQLQAGTSQGKYELPEQLQELLDGDVALLEAQKEALLEAVAELLDEADVEIAVDTYGGEEVREPDVETLRELLVDSHYSVERDLALELPGDVQAESSEEIEQLREERDRLQERVDELEAEQTRQEATEAIAERHDLDLQEEREGAQEAAPASGSDSSAQTQEAQMAAAGGAESETWRHLTEDGDGCGTTEVAKMGPSWFCHHCGMSLTEGDVQLVQEESDGEIAAAVDALDLPGDGELLAERQALVQDVVAWIREHGESGRSEIRENVVDPSPAGYSDGYSAWKNLVQPALQELDDEVDALESPGEGGKAWSWQESAVPDAAD